MAQNQVLLLVEDDADAANVVRWLMEPRGYVCVVCESAEAALDYINAHPDGVLAVISDFHLPGIDGVEFGRQLRAIPHGQHIPLVGTTAFHSPELRAKALAIGFNAYFAKPLNLNEFAPVVDKLIYGR